MELNIIQKYVNYIKSELLTFFRIVLGSRYNRAIVQEFITRYLEVRYYNETKFPETEAIARIGKELMEVVVPFLETSSKELVKTINALFGYILYFDDCLPVDEFESLLNALEQDENLKITLEAEASKKLRQLAKRFKRTKEEYFKMFETEQFIFEEKRKNKHLYLTDLKHAVKIPNLYSEAAINSVYEGGIINEDKRFVLLLMTSKKILENAINLKFTNKYFIDFPGSMFEKEKKTKRFFNYIDNPLAKKHLLVNIRYEDYLAYAKIVESLISEGFSFSVTINHQFDENYAKLVLFNYIFLYNDSKFYGMMIENEARIMSELVVL